jgi:release factor glutamine methyltransferase
MNSKIHPVPPPPAPTPRVWTTLDLLNWTKPFFEKKGISPALLEAQLLLAEALKCERMRLYTDFEKPIGAEQLATFRDFVRRRADLREPSQYILGHTQFIDLKLKVSPSVLIPRPETELLALWAVARAKEAGDAPVVLDLCTGSGCLALYVASKVPGARVVATDISPEALALARENAAALKLSERVEFLAGDLFAALSDGLQFDVLVTNPPYIDEAGRADLQPEVRDHEPAVALFAPERGLGISKRILAECARWLKPGGWLGLEFGIHHDAALATSAQETGHFASVALEKDSAKIMRFLHARKA